MATLAYNRVGTDAMTTRKTILVVDDEPAVLELVKVILSRDGYTVLTAASGPRALDACAEDPGRVDLLLTDVMMPEMSGFALMDGMRDLCPGLPVLFMTGGAPNGLVNEHSDSRCRLLTKPFDPRTLLIAVDRLLSIQNHA